MQKENQKAIPQSYIEANRRPHGNCLTNSQYFNHCTFFFFQNSFKMVFNKSSLYLIAIFLSVACAQLQNSVELDPEGSFRLDWTVDYSADPNNPRIVFNTFVKTQGRPTSDF